MVLFFFRLGIPGLMDPDEGRYAEIAREMLVTGEFITPQLNFLPYLEKPPLVYWLTALSLKMGGLNEWSARLVPALSALGGMLAVYWLAATLWDPETGFLAGFIAATSSGYFILGRLLTLDMTLTALMTWGTALAYVALRNHQRRYLPWAYLALALGVLAKGPVAVVLPALIFLTWFFLQKQWLGFFRLWHTGGVCLFALVVAPWYILVAWHNPDFLSYFIFQEHLQRYLTPRIHAGQPVYFYFGVLVIGFLPWVNLLPWAWQASKPQAAPTAASQDRLFLLLWFGVIFIFYSLSHSKLFPYLLPGIPPLALLVAKALAGGPECGKFSGPWWRGTLWVWVSASLLILTLWVLVTLYIPSVWQAIAFLSPYPAWYSLILALPPAILLTGLIPLPRWRYLLLGSALVLNLLLLFGMERVAETRSPKMLAQIINSRASADSIIVGFHYYSQGISFYTGRPIYLFQTRGELEFGLQQKPENPYYLGWPAELPELLARQPDFFVLINRDKVDFFQTMYHQPIMTLAPWKNILLLGSQ